MIGGIVAKVRNLCEYIKKGGALHVRVHEFRVDEQFFGKRILVTGGGSGIGLAVAKRLVGMGARVLITGRDESKLLRACAEIGERATFVKWDIRDVKQTEVNIARAEGLLGGALDAAVLNAGIAQRQGVRDISFENWDAVLSTNLTGNLFLLKALCEKWRKDGREGRVVNLSSFAGVGSVVDAYGVSKSALIGITRGWASAYAQYGIRINCVAPGVIVGTGINKIQREIDPKANVYCGNLPARRYGVPDEIASVVVFLLGEESSYVYGQTIVCDGGATLG